MNKKVLLAGESWTSTATHAKGFDQFASITHHNGAEQFLALFERGDYAITYMPSHDAQTHFPMTLEALNEWDAVILSDIGANTLLLHPDTWINSQRSPNRLKLLRDYVAAGGGLMMIGGYLSFQGINGSARFRNTPVEEVLPVRCLPYDDRVEVPEGFTPECVTQHPLVHGIDGAWPHLLGYNEVELKPDATLVMQVPGTARANSAQAARLRGLATCRCTGCRRSSRRGTVTSGCGATASTGSRGATGKPA